MLIQTNKNVCAECCAANYKNDAPNHLNSKINLLPNKELKQYASSMFTGVCLDIE
jgi:hypothetical protein